MSATGDRKGISCRAAQDGVADSDKAGGRGAVYARAGADEAGGA